MSVSKPEFQLTAKFNNIESVEINGRNITIKNDNTISEILVFSPGDNIIHIGLTDALGKQKIYKYHIFYTKPDQHYPYSLKEAQKQLQQEETKATEEKTLTAQI